MGEKVAIATEKLVQTNPKLDKKRINNLKHLDPEAIQLLTPPITVGQYEDRYFVLDGSHRVETLKTLGVQTILVDIALKYNEDPTPQLRKFLNFSF